MSRKSKEAVESSAASKFDPKKLTLEQQALVVEEFLGVHPRYFLYEGLQIKLNHGAFRHDGHHFNGWKPKKYKYNSFDG